MGGISKTTRGGISLHAKWRRERTSPAAPKCGPPNDSSERGTGADESEDEGAHESDGTANDATRARADSDTPVPTGAKRKREANEPEAIAQVNSKKPRTMPLEEMRTKYPPAIIAAVKRAQEADVEFHFPPMKRDRFTTFDEFEAYATEYFARLFGGYRRRSSLSTLARNDQLRKADTTAREAASIAARPFKSSLELLPWDSEDIFYRVVYWCLHGCIQKKRGFGQRVTLYTRFTACSARITAQLQHEPGPDGAQVWFVKVVNEYPVHNHHVSAVVYATYNTTAMIVGEAELFQRVAWAADVGGDPRIVRDIVSRWTGSNYSQRKYANLVQYWLGGAPVLKSLQSLVEAFAALPGYRCLIIKDGKGVLVGLVFQSAYQRAVVRANGDTLTMDWTHGTNNRGFKQGVIIQYSPMVMAALKRYYIMWAGAFVATTANGTSVPVLDFLCVSQSNKMMESVFSFFIDHNPGVTEKLQSMVIDKDFGEWDTVEKMFPHTVVVLCIFHVLKWFKSLMSQTKYAIELALRDDVLACLRAMVYAVSEDTLTAQKNTLRDLLSPETNTGHEAFLVYMEENWYSCSSTWSYAERGCVFTAGNTTSNRIESLWCSYKGTLGNRRRLDLCVEAIFQHATMIMRREEAALANFIAKTPLHEDADNRMRPVLLDLSTYTAKRVQVQWTKYLARHRRFRVLDGPTGASEVLTVRFSGTKDIDFQVNTSTWTCSCRAHRGIDLPCRHLLFVALDVLHLPVYPVVALRERWRMSEAVKMLPVLTRGIKQLEQLRVRLLLGGTATVEPGQVGSEAAQVASVPGENREARDGEEFFSPSVRFPATPSVVHVHLAQHEISDSRVIGEMQKRNRFDTALEPAVDFATGLSTPDFNSFVQEAAAAMAALVADWQARRRPQAKEADEGEDAGHGLVDPAACFRVNPGPAGRRVVLGEIERQAQHAAWRACRAAADGAEDDEVLAEGEDEEERAGYDVVSTARIETAAEEKEGPLHDVANKALSHVIQQRLLGQHRSLAAGLPSSQELDDMLLGASDTDDVERRADHSSTVKRVRAPPMSERYLAKQPRRVRAAQDGEAVEPDVSNASDEGILEVELFTLPPEKGRGNRRTSKQQTAATRPLALVSQATKTRVSTLPPEKGRRARRNTKQPTGAGRPLAHVLQANKTCPLTVREHNMMVQFCIPPEASRLQDAMPVVLTASTVLRRKTTAALRSFQPRSIEQANTVVPWKVYEKLFATLTHQRLQDEAGPYVRRTSDDPQVWSPQYVVKVPQMREFPEEVVDAIGEFYSLREKIAAYRQDMAWISGPWDVPDNARLAHRVPFLQGDADCVERTLDAGKSANMRAEIKREYTTRVLASMLAVPDNNTRRAEPGQRTCIPLLDIVGRLAFDQKLNDSVVNFSLQMLGARHADVVVVDSLNMGKMRVPQASLQTTRLICFPLHDKAEDHWCVLLVIRQQKRQRVVGYDPLGSAAGKIFMAEQWDRWCRLLIMAWNERDQRRSQLRTSNVVDVSKDISVTPVPGLDSLQVAFNSQPRQPDGTSCGLFCVARAAGFMDTRDGFIAGANVDSAAVQLMRLRLLWLVLCHSTSIVDPEKETIARGYYTKFAAFAQ